MISITCFMAPIFSIYFLCLSMFFIFPGAHSAAAISPPDSDSSLSSDSSPPAQLFDRTLPIMSDCVDPTIVLQNHRDYVIPFSRCALLFSDRSTPQPRIAQGWNTIVGHLFNGLMELDHLDPAAILDRDELSREVSRFMLDDNPAYHLKNLLVFGRFAAYLNETSRALDLALSYDEKKDPTRDYDNVEDSRAGVTDHQKRMTSIKFTIGGLQEELGNYAEAMRYYRIANDEVSERIEGKKMTEKYLYFFERMKALHSGEVLRATTTTGRRHDKMVKSICGGEAEIVCDFTFVIGFPRSGTTLVEKLLAEAMDTDYSFGEIPLLR